MKFLLLSFGLIITSLCYAQSIETDLNYLKTKIEGSRKNGQKSGNKSVLKSQETSKDFLNLKKQMLSDCKFQTTCSTYCNKSFSRFGLIKGLFISVDRVLRCDRITSATASPYRKTNDGKMIDYLEEYGM